MCFVVSFMVNPSISPHYKETKSETERNKKKQKETKRNGKKQNFGVLFPNNAVKVK